ncbi:recombinase family protein [Aeromonas salmonicida]|uniref:recombinase family protein n=1 Tax=Aeromonas salmonicida TaxID=645 RepID=UPI000DE58715|nr:recombinase family protein [Aeromonas salmonicida]
MTEPKIYPYSRISSKRQETGQGLTMQEEATALALLSERYNLPVYNRMTDSGKSAFHGDHIKNGALGQFLKAVESGDVAPGSILVVSNLDRFSRQGVTDAAADLLAILRKKIGVHAVMENMTFCDPHGDRARDMVDIQMATLFLERAHGESLTKQKRTNARAELDIARHLRGERHPSGYAYAIEVVGNNTSWVDTTDGSVKPHPIYHETYRQIALRLIDGESPESIAKSLNATGPKAPIKRSDKRAPGTWSAYMIRELHKQRALVGEKILKNQLLLDYYPRVLSDDEYHRLVHARTQNQQPRANSKASAINLFAGLKNVVCAHCGAGIHLTKVPGGHRYYCSQHRYELHCPGWRKDRKMLEEVLLKICVAQSWKESEQKSVSRVPVIVQQLTELKRKIAALTEQAEEQDFPRSLVAKLKELEKKEDSLRIELEQSKVEDATNQVRSPAVLQARWREVTDDVLDIHNDNARRYMRDLLRDSIDQITIGHPSYAFYDKRKQAIDAGIWIGEEKPKGSERFKLVMLISLRGGVDRFVAFNKTGPEMLMSLNEKRLSVAERELLASINTTGFNMYRPAKEDDLPWLETMLQEHQRQDEHDV